MSSKRSFSSGEFKTKAVDYHGSARFVHSSPDLSSKGVKSLNLEIPFDEALKLSLALQSCVQSINRLDRSKRKGRAMGLLLSVKLESSAISVIETGVRSGKS